MPILTSAGLQDFAMAMPPDAAPVCAAVFVRDSGNLVLVSEAFLAYFDVPPHMATAHATWGALLGAISDSTPPPTASLVRHSIAALRATLETMDGEEIGTALLPPLCFVTPAGRARVYSYMS